MTIAPRVIRMHENGPAGLTRMDLDPADFQSPLPEQNVHVYYSDATRGLNVGVWDTTTMQEAFGPYPGDEFIVVLEGRFAMLDGDGDGVPVEKGQLVAFRNGIPVSWKQDGYLKKFYLTLLDPNADTPKIASAKGGVIVIDPTLELTGDDILPDVEGAVEREREFFTSDDGAMTVGLWDCQAFEGEIEPFPSHEFCFVVAGEVTIKELGGISQTFTAGDAFFVPKGTECSWHVPKYIRKFFAAVDHED
ncbi:cupin domain-containing protein [Yoonia sp. F2084L]|uniref:cupin domain-containing protein n=1 Tax=Yoonia sp. F2084L TaxID=2926419 RepID=UPI001FF4C2EF|nr:cupin domain-containing protein [Yoonia sp. F2084L]MCK0096744.1 cupin domain-containing protein [Yoonia sp. F2084L]